MARKCVFWITILLFIMIGLAPVAAMLVKSIFVSGELSLKNYAMLFKSKREWTLLFNSLVLSGATTLITILLGVPLGVLFAKTDLPFKRLFAVLFVVPLIIPSYIIAVAWFYFLGRSGTIAGIFGSKAGILASSFLFSFPGTLFVTASVFLPIVIILTMTYLRMVNPRLEEAAKLSAAWFLILRRISIPIIKPGIFLAGLIVFILTAGEFGVPSFLRFDVFPVESFIQFSAFYNFNTATAAAIPLGIITLIVLVVERLFLRKKIFQFRLTKEAMIMAPLGKTKPLFFAAVCALVFILVLIPLGVLSAKSFSPWAYREAFIRSIDSIFRSLLYASIGATCLVLFSFILGYLLERKAIRFYYAVDSAAIFLFALPGTVTGIGLISLWNTQATNFIYASMCIILFGYIAQYTALGERIMAATFSQIPHSMEEAAQVVGAGWFRRLSGILIPLAKRGLVAAWFAGFIFCLRDLGLATMVSPPDHDTLPVRIFTLMANSPDEVTAALCIIMVVIAFLPLCALALAVKYIARHGRNQNKFRCAQTLPRAMRRQAENANF
ncbi:MAG: iron ABC transporter permease [Nitrospinae bacterium]|nr:iron ABC transporter permease [Nitrospinota bacterium]